MTSLRFSTAIHVLLLLAHAKADTAERAVSSSNLAGSIGANPVVVRRILVSLTEAGLIQTRSGSAGGAWLARAPGKIRVDEVYAAVEEGPPISYRKKGNSDCPIGNAAPGIICGLGRSVTRATQNELAKITLAQLLKDLEKAAAAEAA